MWGRKAKRIKALRGQHARDEAALHLIAEELVDARDAALTLRARCDSLAAELKAALNDPRCFDCRRGHHDHFESGTCRRPDCRCKQ
jgi:hypothetical protein